MPGMDDYKAAKNTGAIVGAAQGAGFRARVGRQHAAVRFVQEGRRMGRNDGRRPLARACVPKRDVAGRPQRPLDRGQVALLVHGVLVAAR
eukprot:4147972-Pyramimonas_sp.AAC.1